MQGQQLLGAIAVSGAGENNSKIALDALGAFKIEESFHVTRQTPNI